MDFGSFRVILGPFWAPRALQGSLGPTRDPQTHPKSTAIPNCGSLVDISPNIDPTQPDLASHVLDLAKIAILGPFLAIFGEDDLLQKKVI